MAILARHTLSDNLAVYRWVHPLKPVYLNSVQAKHQGIGDHHQSQSFFLSFVAFSSFFSTQKQQLPSHLQLTSQLQLHVRFTHPTVSLNLMVVFSSLLTSSVGHAVH